MLCEAVLELLHHVAACCAFVTGDISLFQMCSESYADGWKVTFQPVREKVFPAEPMRRQRSLMPGMALSDTCR